MKASSAKRSYGNTKTANRFSRYIATWEEADLSKPNYLLTINCTPRIRKRVDVRGMTWTQAFGKEVELVKRQVEKMGQTWLALYVVDNTPYWHVHVLFWLPEVLEERLLRYLARSYKVKAWPAIPPFEVVRTGNSGQPINLCRCTDAKKFEGEPGWQGAVRYISRHLDLTVSSRTTTRGDLTRASHTVASLGWDRSKAQSCSLPDALWMMPPNALVQ